MTRHYTTGEVAEMLGVTADKVLDWIHTGQVAAIDVSLHSGGGKARWRISADDLADFLRRRRTRPPAPAPRRRKRQEQVTRYY